MARVNGPRERGGAGAHQVVDPADVPRFAELGVIANLEPLWAQLDPLQVDLTLPRLGPERGAWQYPMASLLATGAVLSMGSDWPVSSYRPLDGLAVAVTRQTADGVPAEGWLPAGAAAGRERAVGVHPGASPTRRSRTTPGARSRSGRRADLVWLGRRPPPSSALDWPGSRSAAPGWSAADLGRKRCRRPPDPISW